MISGEPKDVRKSQGVKNQRPPHCMAATVGGMGGLLVQRGLHRATLGQEIQDQGNNGKHENDEGKKSVHGWKEG